MASKDKNPAKQKKIFAFVVSGICGDRHSTDEPISPKLFSTKAKAVSYVAAEAKRFLLNYYGVDEETGAIDYNTIDCITDSPENAKDLSKVIKDNDYLSINVDDEGTYSQWDISKLPIE